MRVVPCALGAEPGEVAMHVFAGLPHGGASVSALGRDNYITHRVRRSTLEAELAGSRPAVLKLDAGRGARRAARPHGDAAPLVLFEVNRGAAAAVGYEPVDLAAELCRHNPYELFRIQDGALVPEREPATAHGVTWVAVPPGRSDRVCWTDPPA